MSWCPNCGHPVQIPLPVEPLYTSEIAAGLVPTTRIALLALLRRHKDELPPPYYRIWHRIRYRMISATEIRWARDRLLQRTIRSLSPRPRYLKVQPEAGAVDTGGSAPAGRSGSESPKLWPRPADGELSQSEHAELPTPLEGSSR